MALYHHSCFSINKMVIQTCLSLMYDSWTCQTVSKQRFMFVDMLHCSTVNDNLTQGAQTVRGEQFTEVRIRPTLSGEKLVEQIHIKHKQQLDVLNNI